MKLIQEKASINNQLNLIYQIFIYIQFFIININQRRKKIQKELKNIKLLKKYHLYLIFNKNLNN